MNSETEKKIHELQMMEHTLQSMMSEKQNVEVELNEVLNALGEVENSEDDIYKIVGEIMIKSKKELVLKDLEEKKKVLDLRISSFDKQESLMEKKISEQREEIKSLIDKKE